MLHMASLQLTSSLFAGSSHQRVLQHNTKALDEDILAIVRKMIVLSVLHGGSGPAFFAEPVAEYHFGECGAIKASIVNVPDQDVQDKLIQVCHTLVMTSSL